MLATPLFALALTACAGDAADRTPVPARYDHERIVFTPRIGGGTVTFYTDTGGGWNAIRRSVATRLSLPVEEPTAPDALALAPFPDFDADAALPPAPAHFSGGRLAVADDAQLARHGMTQDGFLGGRYFADGVWELDYLGDRVAKLDGWTPPASDAHRVPLGFQTGDDGARTTHFPRITVTIDGGPLDLLFDTGATTDVSADAAALLGVDAGAAVGTSFIEPDVMDGWIERHPDWRVVADGASLGPKRARMIEVPRVTVAGHEVGPVWFSERAPGAFGEYMASMMDAPPVGALGGSAFRYFRIVIDYLRAAAWFFRDGGCDAATAD